MALQKFLSSSAGVALLAVSSHAAAQEVPVSQPQSASTAAASAEIIVTAQRRSESLQRTPVAVSVVTGDALARQAIVSERDLQMAAPGLTVKAQQNDNQLNYSLRGQTVDTFTSSLPAVLPYVNEVQVGGVGQTAFYDLQSVQVLKGPQGTLFGRNATGGAVLFTTRKPTDELSGYGSVRYGRFNDFQLEGAVGGAIVEDQVLVRVAGVYRSRDGYQLNLYDGSKLGKIEREGVRFSLTLKPSPDLTNDLVAEYYHDKGTNISGSVSYVVPASANAPGYPFVPTNVLFPGLADFAQAQRERGPFVVDVDSLGDHRISKWVVSNITSFEIADNVTLKNVFGYVHVGFLDAGDLDGTSYGIDGRGNAQTGAQGSRGTIEQISDELQLVGKAIDGRLEYVTGVYAAKIADHTRNTSYILNELGLPPQINAGTTTSKAIAGYAQGTFDTGLAGFKVTGGIRYTSEKVSFVRDADDLFSAATHPEFAPFYADGRFIDPQRDTFNKLSWTAGIQNQVTPDLLLYASSRRSFRSGGFNFHAPPTPGFADESGGEYRPEIATDVELGAKFHGYAGTMPVNLNLALYNMWVKNVQRAFYTSIYGGLAGITVNVPKAKIRGFELDGNIRPADWLVIGGNVNYTHARFTDNVVSVIGTDGTSTGTAVYDTYPDTPKWSGVFYSDITIPVSERFNAVLHGDVYAQTSNYYSSTGKSLNPNTQIPGYALANFRVGLEQKEDGLSLSVLVKNAFKKTYYSGGIGFASLFGLNFVVPGEPRTFMLEARYRF